MAEIARGAEAVLTREDNILIKDRIEKSYRLKELDERLRAERTKTEARLLDAARRAGVPVPTVRETQTHVLKMDFIEGVRLRDVIDETPAERLGDIAQTMGRQIGKLHRVGVVHGDLTTSNMILAQEVYFIDFGLGVFSKSVEDRAVDLYILHNAIKSTHYKNMKKLWAEIVRGYGAEFKEAAHVLERLKKIELRGRYTRRLG